MLLCGISNGKVYEIDIHPITVTFCSLENIYTNMSIHTMEKLIEVFNDIVNKQHKKSTKTVEYTRKHKLIDVTKTITFGKHLQFNVWR